MAIMFPISNGNWSDAANWNSDDPLRVGTVPTVGDEVYLNNKNITPDIDIKVTSITNSSLPALSIATGGWLLGFSGAERTIEALLIPGWSLGSADMLRIDTTAGQTLNLIGGAAVGTTGTISLFRQRVLEGTINFYGDYPINLLLNNNSGSAQINIYGTISTVGTSIILSALQSIKVRIFGTVINAASGFAITNSNPSIPVEVLSLQHDYTKAGAHISGRFAFMTGVSYIGEDTSGNPLPLTDPTTADQALPQDVRFGTVYNNGGLTGTSKMPAKEVVSKDIIFDNGTLGEAILTAEAVSQAAAQVVGAQFNAFKG